MQAWKIVETLSNPKDPEWEILVHSTLGDKVHADRKMGFLLSREALKSCFSSNGIKLEIAQLKLTGFHQVLDLSHYTISLSHTKNWGAALVADRKIFRSVGIDIEFEERSVKASILGRIAHQDDHSLRNIELWCLKEAAFKALMNSGLFAHPLEFSSIKIGLNSWSHSPSGLEGKWELDLINSMIVARAYLEN